MCHLQTCTILNVCLKRWSLEYIFLLRDLHSWVCSGSGVRVSNTGESNSARELQKNYAFSFIFRHLAFFFQYLQWNSNFVFFLPFTMRLARPFEFEAPVNLVGTRQGKEFLNKGKESLDVLDMLWNSILLMYERQISIFAWNRMCSTWR